ncbi:3-phytase [Jackrogersella minutella]|nr:3-phytase [Jackrogersella minutella]
MRSLGLFAASLAANLASAALEINLPISARSDVIESDFTAVYYDAARPVLVGNDGGASTGGFHTFDLDGETNLTETNHQFPGRTKLVTTLYDVGGKDLIVTIAQPDSYFRLYDASTAEQVGEPLARTLGDWSAVCAWKSQSSGEQYLYLFGKSQAIHFLVRGHNGSYEFVEIQTFGTEVEASTCAVSLSAKSVYFAKKDDATVYTFAAAETTMAPQISVMGKADDDVTGLGAYIGADSDYLFVAQSDIIAVYDTSFKLLGSIAITGDDDIEVKGLNFYQTPTQKYPAGAITYAIEDGDGKGFAASSLETAFNELALKLNTAYDPRWKSVKASGTVCSKCNLSGFCQKSNGTRCGIDCSCFAGFEGTRCADFTCRNDCSAHGKCIGANLCECDVGWGGLYCAFKVVKAVVETDAFGGDGDDPAIWISPIDKSESRIITTIKSEEGSGLAVFDLDGKLQQTFSAGEPDNVDVIYGFQAGNRSVDLAYAACRTDNTLCLFEITSNGTLQAIAGGSQPTKDDYEVYGSCVYRSRKSGKQYLFVNAKSAEYLQYELTWADGALQTSLVRSFTGGSGGQVEGCVADEPNGWIFIGEEPHALWRYGAEPDDDSNNGFIIGEVGDGKMYADNEGVTLIEGPSADKGFILVSQQGVSAYNVYRRAAPHEYVETFTIYENKAKGIDAVTNTDGLAAVGAGLGSAFPNGLVAVHDDANQLPDGGTSEKASFKLVDLKDILDDELLKEVDTDWDPRVS